MRRVLTNILVILVLVTGLEAAHRPTHPGPEAVPLKTPDSPRSRPQEKPYQIGKASWYGRLFHGKKTASGETYNMYRMTAAHRHLPLGTLVKVTNLENGESVIVRVNDRGPVPHNRIIDLSYGAASVLGMKETGIQPVRLDIVEPEPESVTAEASDMP
ncbi:MAG: septal ring lytic transglycosylase RlpA family protein [Terriglobales bacterium]